MYYAIFITLQRKHYSNSTRWRPDVGFGFGDNTCGFGCYESISRSLLDSSDDELSELAAVKIKNNDIIDIYCTGIKKQLYLFINNKKIGKNYMFNKKWKKGLHKICFGSSGVGNCIQILTINNEWFQ